MITEIDSQEYFKTHTNIQLERNENGFFVDGMQVHATNYLILEDLISKAIYQSDVKRDSKAPRHDLIPPCVARRLAAVYTYGAGNMGIKTILKDGTTLCLELMYSII